MDLSSSASPATLTSSAPLPIPMCISSPEQQTDHLPGHLSLRENDSLQVSELTNQTTHIALATVDSWGVTAWLACMLENCRGICRNPMMGSGRLLEGRSVSNDEVSMSHGCSGQDLDYPACWPVLAWSMQCKRRASAQEATQWSLDALVSLMIVHD